MSSFRDWEYSQPVGYTFGFGTQMLVLVGAVGLNVGRYL